MCSCGVTDGDTGRVLRLDTLRHSYVDLADPTHLEFEYVRAIASVTDVLAPPGRSTSWSWPGPMPGVGMPCRPRASSSAGRPASG